MNEQNHVAGQSINDIYSSDQYKQYSRRKLLHIWSLIAVSLTFYFSVPLLNMLVPSVMNSRITGSLNVGFVWVIMQYPLGGLIAWYYVRKMREFDRPQWFTQSADRSSLS